MNRRARLDFDRRQVSPCGSPCTTCLLGLACFLAALPVALVMACVRTAKPKQSPGDGPEGYPG